jgi:hypothetical protein
MKYADEVDSGIMIPSSLKTACLPAGATALGEPWTPLQPVSTVRFLNKIIFYRMPLLAPCPTPNLEDQGVSLLVWILPFDLTGMGDPTGS